MRTLLENKNECKPEKFTVIFARDLNSYYIGIAAVSEIHREGDDLLKIVDI